MKSVSMHVAVLISFAGISVYSFGEEATDSSTEPQVRPIAERLSEACNRIQREFGGQKDYLRYAVDGTVLVRHQQITPEVAYLVGDKDALAEVRIVDSKVQIHTLRKLDMAAEEIALRSAAIAGMYFPNPLTILSGYQTLEYATRALPSDHVVLSVQLPNAQVAPRLVESHLDSSNRLLLHRITAVGQLQLQIRYRYQDETRPSVATQIETLWRDRASGQLFGYVDMLK